jgi:hypothetical protein
LSAGAQAGKQQDEEESHVVASGSQTCPSGYEGADDFRAPKVVQGAF